MANEGANDDVKWKCEYCSYKNDVEDKRCIICKKISKNQNSSIEYPKDYFPASKNEFRSFTAHNGPTKGGKEEEELQATDRADRDNLIIKLAEDEKMSWAQAMLAVKLMELNYDTESAVDAAKQCSTFEAAQAFLKRECPICGRLHPESKMESMYFCEHSCCVLCAKQYFTQQVKERSLLDITCPVCAQPKLGESITMHEYYSKVDFLLKRILDDDVYEILQTKLRDYSLSQDSTFFWCTKCKDSFGFYPEVLGKKFTCPRCRISFCAKCKNQWKNGHKCLNVKKKFHTYTNELDRFLNDNFTSCPKCKTKYNIIRGGCLHLTCSLCRHSWCVACNKPFYNGKICTISKKCNNRGLHAHHPRNCFFYGRDRDYKKLQKLLNDNGVAFDLKPLKRIENSQFCPVLEGRSDGSGTKEEVCGLPVEEGLAGLCVRHYREYLSMLIMNAGVDPVDVMDINDLKSELERNDIEIPDEQNDETDANYYNKLKKMVMDYLPLQSTSSF